MSLLLTVVLLAQVDTIKQLDHKDPGVRANACDTLARMKVTSSIEQFAGEHIENGFNLCAQGLKTHCEAKYAG